MLARPSLMPAHYCLSTFTALSAASSIHLSLTGAPLIDTRVLEECHAGVGAASAAAPGPAAACCCRLLAAAFVFLVLGCGLLSTALTWRWELSAKRAYARDRLGRRLVVRLPLGAERLGALAGGGARGGAPCALVAGFCGVVALWYISEVAAGLAGCPATCAAAGARAAGAALHAAV
jgi:hypothetical protein